MLFISVFILTLLPLNYSQAFTPLQEKILSVDFGTNEEDALIFYSSGKVVHIPAAKKFSTENINHGISKSLSEYKKKFQQNGEIEKYSPSILESFDEAKKLFDEMRSDFDVKSQCYNRAHVWAYEWRTEKNIFSSKMWLFFTPKYIRKFKFDWWFHVAPMVHIINQNSVRERVMDKKYAKTPLKLKEWTDIFIKDQSDCPVINSYSDYADYPESSFCYVMKSSMYYYRPLDLEEIDFTHVTKQRWNGAEVINAYFDGFNIIL
jgi:hypothetical protein